MSVTGLASTWTAGCWLTTFYDGDSFEIGFNRHAPDIYGKELLLKILPLQKVEPIDLPEEAWPGFRSAESMVLLNGVDVIAEHEVKLHAR